MEKRGQSRLLAVPWLSQGRSWDEHGTFTITMNCSWTVSQWLRCCLTVFFKSSRWGVMSSNSCQTWNFTSSDSVSFLSVKTSSKHQNHCNCWQPGSQFSSTALQQPRSQTLWQLPAYHSQEWIWRPAEPGGVTHASPIPSHWHTSTLAAPVPCCTAVGGRPHHPGKVDYNPGVHQRGPMRMPCHWGQVPHHASCEGNADGGGTVIWLEWGDVKCLTENKSAGTSRPLDINIMYYYESDGWWAYTCTWQVWGMQHPRILAACPAHKLAPHGTHGSARKYRNCRASIFNFPHSSWWRSLQCYCAINGTHIS